MGNSTFPTLILVTAGAALALGAGRFNREVVPHLSILEKYNIPGFRPLNAVVKFISQEPSRTEGIQFAQPIHSTSELPSRIKLASGPRSKSNSLAHFVYAENLAAFQYKRRCPFTGFFENELSVIENGFERTGTLNRFLNKRTRIERRHKGKPK